jgi:predicted enzyme related to lactoylglutathione lyase
MRSQSVLGLAAALVAGALCGDGARADPPGHVTGVGGVFLRSKDPKALAAWYRDVLGMPMEAWGGALLRADASKHPRVTAWTVLGASTHYLEPSTAEFMIDYAVDDLDAILARVRARGVEVLKTADDDNGRFAWILDPEGRKLELWEPKPPPAP